MSGWLYCDRRRRRRRRRSEKEILLWYAMVGRVVQRNRKIKKKK